MAKFRHNPLTKIGLAGAMTLLFLLLMPIIALVLTSSIESMESALSHRLLMPALALTLKTSLFSIVIIIMLGTPLAWWLSGPTNSRRTAIAALIQLPIVIPPAVVGVGLLQSFGRKGLFGPTLDFFGLSIPFTETAVIIAQVVVASPFYVQAATTAFRTVDPDMMLVARTLGASPRYAFFRVAIPTARSGLLVGTALAWARCLGEFGATLLFAGNLSGVSQTMPLAIFSAFESNSDLAVGFSIILASIGIVALAALTRIPSPADETSSR